VGYWFNAYEELSEITTIPIEWKPGPGTRLWLAEVAPRGRSSPRRSPRSSIERSPQRSDDFGDDATVDYRAGMLTLQTDGDLENEEIAEEIVEFGWDFARFTRRFVKDTLRPKMLPVWVVSVFQSSL
jgi:hypothetical protein